MDNSTQNKILIVDDEEAILTMLQQILRLEGYAVDITNSGIEALYLLAQDHYQLLITDINMPQMDGLILTQRALEYDPELAIILTTGARNRDTAYQAYELGATGYLLKPFDPNEIRIYVANTLRLRELEIANTSHINHLEEQVQVNEQRLKSVVSQLPVVLWALDRQGRFTLSEGKGLKDLGLRPGEVVGQSAFDLYDHLPEVKDAIQQSLDGKALTRQFWVDTRLYENNYTPLKNAEGKLEGMICISIDITETHQLQTEIAQKTQLASLGELAAGVAHEINNPNALILHNSRELTKICADIIPLLDAEYQRNGDFRLGMLDYTELRQDLPLLLENMVESARRIRTIVSELRDFASDEPQLSLQEQADMNQVVRSALPYVEQLINDSTDNFSVTYAHTSLPIDSVPKRLEQVIINLLQNACHALTDKSAAIAVRLSHDAKSRRQIVEIIDEGSGINRENLLRIKEPFFTTRRNRGGTGLGLSVSMRIIEDCMGHLDFKSTPGAGTIATLSFPAACEDFAP